jgi:hypothetical protein
MLPDRSMQELLDYFEVSANTSQRDLTRRELMMEISNKEALICLWEIKSMRNLWMRAEAEGDLELCCGLQQHRPKSRQVRNIAV